MVVGFNHNVMYKGDIFHIQTEDSGLANPHIITLLYRGGTILASKKTSYADIIKMENLEKVVEELMKEQHKEMLRNLKAGQFDDRAFGTAPSGPAPAAQPQPVIPPTPPTPPTPVAPTKPAAPVQPQPAAPSPPAPRPVTSSPSRESRSGLTVQSLDEVILDYLVRGDDH